jgi:hypothetical protein
MSTFGLLIDHYDFYSVNGVNMMDRKILLTLSAAIILQLSSGFASDPSLQDNAESSSPHVSAVVEQVEQEDVAKAEGFVVISAKPDEKDDEQPAAVQSTSLVSRARSLTYDQVKDLDQNGSKYVGLYVKGCVEKIPGGKVVTAAAGFVARAINPNAESLTEVGLNALRSPLKLPADNYPETTPGVAGAKLQQAVVTFVPYGAKAVVVAQTIANAYGKDTLCEVVAEKFGGSSPAAEPKKPDAEEKKEEKKDE